MLDSGCWIKETDLVVGRGSGRAARVHPGWDGAAGASPDRWNRNGTNFMATQTMRALVLESYNSPFKLSEIPRPIPQAGEVLVRIQASGLNPLDTKIRAGKAEHAQQPLPAVLGLDMAGTVEQVGAGVT